MNIVISNSRASYYIGGTEVVSMHQAIWLAKAGHSIRYIIREVDDELLSGYFQDFLQKILTESLSINVERVPMAGPFGDGISWDIWDKEAQLFGISAQDAYLNSVAWADLMVTHMSTDAIYIPRGIPHCLHLHGTPKNHSTIIDQAMGYPSHTIAHSTSIYDWWHNHYPDVPMEVFRNGVPVDTFYEAIEADRPIDILYVGRILKHKGIEDILLAADPEQRIVIAGKGHPEAVARLKAIVSDRKLQVLFVNSPNNKTLVNLYKNSKIFACPSRGKEGVLTTMLEAGAAGCAVVTSSGSGMTDLAVHNSNSLIIRPGNTKELREAFAKLLHNKGTRLRLAKSMQDTIAENWSWKFRIKQLEEIYDRASKFSIS